MDRSERQRQFEEEAYPLLDALYRTALRMTGQAAAAEDLVQETMIKAYKNLHRFERGTNFRAWLFRILTNNFINEVRRKGRAPQAMDFAEADPGAPEREAAYFTVDDLAQLRERLGDASAQALEKVPTDFRLVFLLSTFEDFSYKEIAEIVGAPIGTVMSRLFRARKILREELYEYAIREGFLKQEGRG